MKRKNKILLIVKNKIHSIDPFASIILFGSRARNEERIDSDWDFLILTEKPVTPELKNRIGDSLFEAELDTNQVITGIIQNKSTWNQYSNTPFYINVKNDGIEL